MVCTWTLREPRIARQAFNHSLPNSWRISTGLPVPGIRRNSMPAVSINGAMPSLVSLLLYVPTHPARTLDADLVRAGIPKEAVGGKLDFHAVRLAYIRHYRI